jgi:hypothetical protein
MHALRPPRPGAALRTPLAALCMAAMGERNGRAPGVKDIQYFLSVCLPNAEASGLEFSLRFRELRPALPYRKPRAPAGLPGRHSWHSASGSGEILHRRTKFSPLWTRAARYGWTNPDYRERSGRCRSDQLGAATRGGKRRHAARALSPERALRPRAY